MKVVKFLAVVEIVVDLDRGDPVETAQETLDHFRENLVPAENYGITIYRATSEDLTETILKHQVVVTCESAPIEDPKRLQEPQHIE